MFIILDITSIIISFVSIILLRNINRAILVLIEKLISIFLMLIQITAKFTLRRNHIPTPIIRNRAFIIIIPTQIQLKLPPILLLLLFLLILLTKLS